MSLTPRPLAPFKFPVDTTLIGLIPNGDESTYSPSSDLVKSDQLGAQCSKDSRDGCGFREDPASLTLITLCDSAVESLCFLGTIITKGPKSSWPHQQLTHLHIT